jgi:RNA polymerase sigma factor (sigma-70 family)
LTDRLAEDLHGAFPALVRSELDVVYTALFRAGGSRVDAEDIAQETFMRAYSALGGYLPDRIRELRLRSWLLTIAMNLWRNELRRRSRHPLVDGERQEESDVHIGPEDEALRGEERGELATLVGSLPEIYREPVVLRHIVDLPLTEIAEILQRPTGTVKAQVSRGLALLRRNLEDHEMEEAR